MLNKENYQKLASIKRFIVKNILLFCRKTFYIILLKFFRYSCWNFSVIISVLWLKKKQKEPKNGKKRGCNLEERGLTVAYDEREEKGESIRRIWNGGAFSTSRDHRPLSDSYFGTIVSWKLFSHTQKRIKKGEKA